MNAYELKQVSAMIKSLENTFMERLRQMERSYLDALKGFGIIDDEKMWTEKQVCEKYGIDRKTMYNYRKMELIPFTRKGERGKIYYLPADVRAFFADCNPHKIRTTHIHQNNRTACRCKVKQQNFYFYGTRPDPRKRSGADCP